MRAPITRDHIEAKFRELNGEVGYEIEAARPQVLTVAAVVAVTVIAIVFLAGRRGGASDRRSSRSDGSEPWTVSFAFAISKASGEGCAAAARCGSSSASRPGPSTGPGESDDEVVYRTALQPGEGMILTTRPPADKKSGT